MRSREKRIIERAISRVEECQGDQLLKLVTSDVFVDTCSQLPEDLKCRLEVAISKKLRDI